jgi:hypothetical protein
LECWIAAAATASNEAELSLMPSEVLAVHLVSYGKRRKGGIHLKMSS